MSCRGKAGKPWWTKCVPRMTRSEPTRRWRHGARKPTTITTEKWVSPYIDRRRENGWGLYGVLGIGKGDKDKMHLQHQRNYRFFDAPVGLMFTIDRVMGRGSLLDYGMFLENLMVAARARGLHTCPQAAWNGFASIILPHIGAGPDEMLVCGMSLGHADEQAVVNTFHTHRVPVEAFTHWLVDRTACVPALGIQAAVLVERRLFEVVRQHLNNALRIGCIGG